jgi:hypothetical protein
MIAHIIGIRLSHATDHERLTFRCFLEPWVTGYEPLEYLGCGLVVRRRRQRQRREILRAARPV